MVASGMGIRDVGMLLSRSLMWECELRKNAGLNGKLDELLAISSVRENLRVSVMLSRERPEWRQNGKGKKCLGGRLNWRRSSILYIRFIEELSLNP